VGVNRSLTAVCYFSRMLRKLLQSYQLVAADARNAVADRFHQIFDADADQDAAFFAVATKKLCAGAIFCEVAMADGKLEPAEQERIRDLLLVRFGLDDTEADALFKIGQQATADASRLPRMTASVRDNFDNEERIELLEMLFDISYADGEQSQREVELAEQAGAAIGLQPRDIAHARLKIAKRQQMLKPGAKLDPDY
jgi:uncharacterized tellurite resistance protein B-like protein